VFKHIASQSVQDDSGFVVQIADRSTVEYLEPNVRAVVAVDFGIKVNVYRESLRAYDPLQNAIPLTTAKRDQILSGIVAGLTAMGTQVEVVC
jgi:hypothetical protein